MALSFHAWAGGPVIGIYPLPCDFACRVDLFGRPGWAEDPRVMPLLLAGRLGSRRQSWTLVGDNLEL